MKHNYSTKIKHDGFVLITVLLIIVLLTAVLLEFNYASRTNLRAADSFCRRQQALNCARAGLNIALAAIKHNPDLHTNDTLRHMLERPFVYQIASGSCALTLASENGKLNINLLKDGAGRLDRTRIDQLLRLIDLINHQLSNAERIGYDVAPALIDWADADDQITVLPFVTRANTGAENSYYENAPQPRLCGNRLLETIDELGLVRGISPEIIHGSTVLDDRPDQPPRLSDYLTVYGDGKIDINCAPLLVIQSLSEKINPVLARMIVDRRQKKPFTGVTELRNIPGFPAAVYAAAAKTLTVQPQTGFFTVTAHGTVQQSSATITAVIKRNSASEKVDIILYKEY